MRKLTKIEQEEQEEKDRYSICDLTKITCCADCPRFRQSNCIIGRGIVTRKDHLCDHMEKKKADAIEIKFIIQNPDLKHSITKKGVAMCFERAKRL